MVEHLAQVISQNIYKQTIQVVHIINSSYIDKTYARIDGGTSSPGYFTRGSTNHSGGA